MSNIQLEPVGVVVARFQVPSLHPGQRFLIDHVRGLHAQVLIVLGVSGGVRTARYPLTFAERELLVRQEYPGEWLAVEKLRDHPLSNALWSQDLDACIARAYPGRPAVLYGSRRSFIPFYTGRHPVVEVSPVFADSGTAHRDAIPPPATPEGRAALIYAQRERPPFMYATSDLAIVDSAARRILLIGKNVYGGFLSFAGGHAMKSDVDAAEVARREGGEEFLNVRFGPLSYVGTRSIDDPRYRGTSDGVMTTFFRAEYLGGEPAPGDDADSVHWVAVSELLEKLTPWHRPLGKLLLDHW